MTWLCSGVVLFMFGIVLAMLLFSQDTLISAARQNPAIQEYGLSTADLLSALARDGARVTQLRVDGGMVANDWLCQFIADISGVPVERPANTETTALGAALLALVGAGAIATLEKTIDEWRLDRRFTPAMDPAAREREMLGWQRAVTRAVTN